MFKGFTTFGIVSFCMLLISCRTAELAINEMQLNLRNNMLFITLYVNDKKGLFLVDTGAGISLIDYNQAKRYDFNIGAKSNRGSVTGVGGSNTLFTISDIDVMYNEFKTKDFRFYGSDFSMINDVFGRNGIRILGILGSDFLSANAATINYNTKKLMLNARSKVKGVSIKKGVYSYTYSSLHSAPCF